LHWHRAQGINAFRSGPCCDLSFFPLPHALASHPNPRDCITTTTTSASQRTRTSSQHSSSASADNPQSISLHPIQHARGSARRRLLHLLNPRLTMQAAKRKGHLQCLWCDVSRPCTNPSPPSPRTRTRQPSLPPAPREHHPSIRPLHLQGSSFSPKVDCPRWLPDKCPTHKRLPAPPLPPRFRGGKRSSPEIFPSTK